MAFFPSASESTVREPRLVHGRHIGAARLLDHQASSAAEYPRAVMLLPAWAMPRSRSCSFHAKCSYRARRASAARQCASLCSAGHGCTFAVPRRIGAIGGAHVRGGLFRQPDPLSPRALEPRRLPNRLDHELLDGRVRVDAIAGQGAIELVHEQKGNALSTSALTGPLDGPPPPGRGRADTIFASGRKIERRKVRKGGLEPRLPSDFRPSDRQEPSPTATNCVRRTQFRKPR